LRPQGSRFPQIDFFEFQSQTLGLKSTACIKNLSTANPKNCSYLNEKKKNEVQKVLIIIYS